MTVIPMGPPVGSAILSSDDILKTVREVGHQKLPVPAPSYIADIRSQVVRTAALNFGEAAAQLELVLDESHMKGYPFRKPFAKVSSEIQAWTQSIEPPEPPRTVMESFHVHMLALHEFNKAGFPCTVENDAERRTYWLEVGLDHDYVATFSDQNETWGGSLYAHCTDAPGPVHIEYRDSDLPSWVDTPSMIVRAFTRTFIERRH